MHHKCMMLIASLGLICVNAASASADMCFRYESGGGTLIAKGGKLPAANTCEPLGFFENGGLWGAATGSICYDGQSSAILHYTYDGCTGHYFESATCKFQTTRGSLPTTFSSCRGTANQAAFYDETAKLEFCDGTPVPSGTERACVGAFFHPKLDRR
jgi:hypothetical protein